MVLAEVGVSCTQACDARCTPCDEAATEELTATAATCSNASSDACGASNAVVHAPSLFLEGGCVAFGAAAHARGSGEMGDVCTSLARLNKASGCDALVMPSQAALALALAALNANECTNATNATNCTNGTNAANTNNDRSNTANAANTAAPFSAAGDVRRAAEGAVHVQDDGP